MTTPPDNIVMILSPDSLCENCCFDLNSGYSFDMSIYTIDDKDNMNLTEHNIQCIKPMIYGLDKCIDDYNEKHGNVLENKYFLISNQEDGRYGCVNIMNGDKYYFNDETTIKIKLRLYEKMFESQSVQHRYEYEYNR